MPLDRKLEETGAKPVQPLWLENLAVLAASAVAVLIAAMLAVVIYLA